MEAERNLAIERENKILLGKMYSIMNAEPAYKTHKARPRMSACLRVPITCTCTCTCHMPHATCHGLQVKMLNTEVLALEGHLKRKEREALELKIKLKKEERREQRRSSLEAQESAAQLW